MKRFRKWLIRKLGGIPADEFFEPPKLDVKKVNTRTLISEISFTNEISPSQENIKFSLMNGLANELDQYVIYKKVSDDEEEHRTLRKRYKASIEIVINDEVSDFE